MPLLRTAIRHNSSAFSPKSEIFHTWNDVKKKYLSYKSDTHSVEINVVVPEEPVFTVDEDEGAHIDLIPEEEINVVFNEPPRRRRGRPNSTGHAVAPRIAVAPRPRIRELRSDTSTFMLKYPTKNVEILRELIISFGFTKILATSTEFKYDYVVDDN
jgi:hypothetical protein